MSPLVIFVIMMGIGIVGSVTFSIVWDGAAQPKWYKKQGFLYVMGLISSGFFILGATGALGETGITTNYLENKTRQTVADILSNPAFLRDNLNKERIESLFQSSVQARCLEPVGAQATFPEVVKEVVNSLTDIPFRETHTLTIKHSLENKNGVVWIRSRETDEITVVNQSAKPLRIEQPFELRLRKIEGVPVSDLRKEFAFFLNGKQEPFELSKISEDGERVVFKGTKNIDLNSKIKLAFKAVYLIPLDDFISRTFYFPTRGITVKYITTENLHPRLIVYSLNNNGGEAKPDDSSTPPFTEWRIPDDLFIRGHGIILTWKKI